MQTVKIDDLHANLLKYLNLANSGETISVTSEGRLLATITPPNKQKETARKQLELLSQTAVIDDIISPIDTNWNASE